MFTSTPATNQNDLDQDGDFYSDFYKDIYGFRPRHVDFRDANAVAGAIEQLYRHLALLIATPEGREHLRRESGGSWEIRSKGQGEMLTGADEAEFGRWLASPASEPYRSWCAGQGVEPVRA